MFRARIWALAATTLAAAAPLAAQQAPAGTTTQPAQQAQTAAATPLNFSGVIFGSYNYAVPVTGTFNNQVNNQFIVDRAYLTFRMPAGDKTSIRITTDIFQDAGTNAYTVRAKYAYLQYDGDKSSTGAQLSGRLGILQNVLIDHEENFWPRFLSTVPTERAGFFASADAGVAATYTMPSKMGEVYGTIVNGPGYSARERDRFKDFALRVSLTPLATKQVAPLFQGLTLTGWTYKGAQASNFVNGNAGLGLAPVGTALDRSRYGVLVGVREPRMTLAAQYATRSDERDTASATLPVTVIGTKGNLWSVYGTVRPLAFMNGAGKSSIGFVGRYDHVSPTASTDNAPVGYVPPPTSNAYHTLVGGLFWDLSQKAQLALDYQESLASNNNNSFAPPAPSKGYFAHFVVNF